MNNEKLSFELNRCIGCKAKPCAKACPLNVSPTDFIQAAKKGDFTTAASLIAKKNPLPQTCGLVCPDKYCQKACIRGKLDTPIKIPCLQAEIMRRGGLTALTLPASTGKKAAVIGGGPAGLGALFAFLTNGWSVDLYEKSSQLGGAARLIPARRLPPEVLDKEINRLIKNERVNVYLNTDITDFYALKNKYDALVVAIGEPAPRTLGIKGEEESIPYADYLTDPQNYSGNKVAVIGGGEVALDCALTLKEEGVNEVEMFVRRGKNDMRIMKSDHQELENKNILIRALTSITQITKAPNNTFSLTAVMNTLTEDNKAVPLPETEHTLEGYDKVIMALGSSCPANFRPANLPLAGDMTGLAGTVVSALASGKKAAEEVISKFNPGISL